ncbi:MAG: hypothetical protein WA431_07355 [Candidatus Cybelea sp.]
MFARVIGEYPNAAVQLHLRDWCSEWIVQSSDPDFFDEVECRFHGLLL